jgi:hypothetical protein
LLNSFKNKTPLEQRFIPIVEALVADARESGMTFEELLSEVMSWAVSQLHNEEEWSRGKATMLSALEASIIKEFKIAGSIKGASANR